ncbi:MAG: hypothetical protein AABX11_07680 [Nanoarchaeota archaeon]
MEHVLRTISLGKTSEELHSEFVKYSRGAFTNKYLLDAKKQKDAWSIKAGAEFANVLVRMCLEKVKEDIDVTGVIVATFDVASKASFPIQNVKQFMGIKQAVVNSKISPDKIIKMMNEFPRAFYALSFANEDFTLKIKAKAPKSAKPATAGGKEPKAEFCSLKTKDAEIVKELFFDFPDFKEIKVNHTLNIKDIELPKGITEPAMIREKAVRKGVLTRVVKIDEVEHRKEYGFSA